MGEARSLLAERLPDTKRGCPGNTRLPPIWGREATNPLAESFTSLPIITPPSMPKGSGPPILDRRGGAAKGQMAVRAIPVHGQITERKHGCPPVQGETPDFVNESVDAPDQALALV
jgi:hypothetical protein